MLHYIISYYVKYTILHSAFGAERNAHIAAELGLEMNKQIVPLCRRVRKEAPCPRASICVSISLSLSVSLSLSLSLYLSLSLSIYIYLYCSMYRYIYIYTYTCVYIYIYIYTCANKRVPLGGGCSDTP